MSMGATMLPSAGPCTKMKKMGKISSKKMEVGSRLALRFLYVSLM
jgi:hypothetical protein